MRKRVCCGALALILFICLLPATVLPVNASSNMQSSEEVISFIKKMEGFNKYAFWDVSQWSVGYGTAGYPGQVITEQEADKAMREHMAIIDEKLNEFAGKYNLTFTQNEHDALASFSFNCGTGWMKTGGRFRSAIIEGTTLNDFLFYISLWANNSSIPDPILIKRRLCEANIYLNGIYSKSMPEDFSFEILDANGGTPGSNGEDKMQGYSLKQPNPILAKDPQKGSMKFLGWFTEPTGGTQVTELSASTSKLTLYAHYEGDEPEQEEAPQVIAKGTITCDTYVNIRKDAGIGYDLVGKAANGTRVELFQIKTAGSMKWGKTGSGWICMDYIVLDGQQPEEPDQEEVRETPVRTGQVSSQTKLNVRSGPGMACSRVGSLTPGTKVDIYETSTQAGVQWGRIGSNRWVCLDYITMDSQTEAGSEEKEEPKEEAKPAQSADPLFTGCVSSYTNLNVRSGPGIQYSKAGSLAPGAIVEVYEKETANGSPWGRIGSGRWVCLDYVTDASKEEAAEAFTGTGRVNSSTVLNVRSGAGTGYPLTDQLTPGTRVTILEKKTSGGLLWGRTADGWVCMNYITLDD